MKLKTSYQKNIGQLKETLKKVKKQFDALYYGNGNEKVKLTNEEQVKACIKTV